MKKITLLFALLIAFNMLNAQFTMISNDNVIKIKRSILLVILEEEDPKTLEKLAKKDPEELAHYKDQIAGRNFALKSAIEKCWNYSRGVQYKSKEEAK